MSVVAGAKLGPYEILSPIGAGGMGTVWKAHDSRLNRDVAVKTSQAKFSERFEREARAIAALNHPNICQIYDVGPDYLVMEYIDGAPVAPVDSARKLLDIAAQIAEGLAAAHAAGIIHRDLKPDNILITRDGRIKILDFGLAKIAVADATPDDATRTMAAELTDPGTTVGTIAYMSPEQARGNTNLTAQSDQFSFGLVLYELAAGKRAFQRGSAAETMTAIIREDAEALPAKVPAQFRWIVERLMAKEPAERYDSTRDLYRELRQVRDRLAETATSSGTVAASAVRAPSRRHIWIKAGAILVAGLIAGGFAMKWAASADAGIDPIRLTPIAMDTGEENDPVFSPDGNSIAYRRTETEVMVRSLNAIEPVSLVKAQYTVSNIVWTPDGSRVCYRLQSDFWCVGSAGGAPQELLPNMGEDNFLGSINSAAQFTPDGKTLVFLKLVDGRNRLYASSPPGAEPRLVNGVALPATVAQLGPFAPDGSKLIAEAPGGPSSWLIPYPAGTSTKIDIAGGVALAWFPDGRHVLARNVGNELLVADTQSQARRLLMRESAVAVAASVSPDGKRIAYSSGLWNPDVVEYSMDGKRIRPLVNSTRADGGGSWSPSGESFVYDSNVAGPMSIWTRKADGTGAVRIADTGIEPFIALARYSPDGRRIAYPASAGIDVIPASGGRAVQVVASETRFLYLCWSADGEWIWYVKDGSLWKTPSQGGTPVNMNRSATVAGDASADGRWISYTALDGVHVVSPDGKQDRLIHAERASALRSQFGAGGKVLYLLRGPPPSLIVLDVESGRELRTVRFDVDPADAGTGGGGPGSVSPDGKFVLLTTGGRKYDIWMMEGFAQSTRGLLSWFRHWQIPVAQEAVGGSAE